MYNCFSVKPCALVGVLISSIVVMSGSIGFAQSASNGESDSAYLSALDTMVLDMDLDGLASQTFEAETVVAPTLSMMGTNGSHTMDDCVVALALSEENETPVDIFGADAALSECLMPETGAVVSNLALEN